MKAPNTSNPVFNLQTTKSVEDILGYLHRTGNNNAKEAWIIHLVKETELVNPDPYEEGEEEEDFKEKKKEKGKGKGKKNPRTASMSDVSSNSKRRVRNLSFFVRTRLD